MKLYAKDILLSLWFGVAVFALGIPGYLLLSPEVLPAWITLGGSAVMGLWVCVHSMVTEIAASRAVRKQIARGMARYHPPPPQPDDDQPLPLSP